MLYWKQETFCKGEGELIMLSAKKGFTGEPIFLSIEDNCWYFWDETWTKSHGPFSSLQEAEEQFEDYCNEFMLMLKKG